MRSKTFTLDAAVAAAATLVRQGITFTALNAGAAAGNAITVRYVDPAAINQALSVGVVGSAITVNLATGPGGAITSTSTLIRAALVASAPAALLVSTVR